MGSTARCFGRRKTLRPGSGAAALQIPRRAQARSKRGSPVRYLTPQSKLVACLLIFLSVLFFPAFVAADTVNLTWDASNSQVAGYNVFRGTISNGPYTQIN